MALDANINTTRTKTGLSAKSAKPIDDGPAVTIVPDPKKEEPGFFSNFFEKAKTSLDELGTDVGGKFGDALNSIADREIERIKGSDQNKQKIDSTGVELDQAGGTAGKQAPVGSGFTDFFERNKQIVTISVVGIGVLILGFALFKGK